MTVPSQCDSKLLKYSITAGLVAITGTIVASLFTYPALLADGTAGILLGIYGVTAGVYLYFAWFRTRVSSVSQAIALREGIRWGSVLSALWFIEVITGNFGDGHSLLTQIAYFGSTWTAFLLPLAAGFVGARMTGLSRTGTLIGLWGGFISGLTTCLLLIAIALLFNRTLQHDPQTIREYMHSGTATINLYIIGDFTAGAINHLWLVGPLLGMITGTVGGVIGSQLAAQSKLAD